MDADFLLIGPLSPDTISKLKVLKVPEYKVVNALSEQENKLRRQGIRQLDLVRKEERQQQLNKQCIRQELLRKEEKEKRQQVRKKYKNVTQHHQALSKDDEPEL